MKMCNYIRILVVLLIYAVVLHAPTAASAGSYEGAVLGMKFLVGSEEVSSGAGKNNNGEKKDENKEVNKEGEETAAKSESFTCGVEAVVPLEICEQGQGLLCLNTPSLSVVDDYVVIRGTVDKRNSVFSHLRAYVQHDYTKITGEVKINTWASADCDKNDWINLSDGCLDQTGYFGVKAPISELGPYTIMVDAVSLDGEAVSKTVKTSRVVAPVVKPEDITIDPDPAKSEGVVSAAKVHLAVDLLHGCNNCDFIGTSTGGVMVTVANSITTADGGVKTIERRGNIASSGRIDVCVPVMTGKNKLSVKVCNAATGDNCPVVEGGSFDVALSSVAINRISPDDSTLVYDAGKHAKIPLKFSINNYVHENGQCREGDVLIYWNRYKPVSLCPDTDGFYYARLIPRVGINVGTIVVNSGDQKISDSFILGWGKLVNPYIASDTGWIDGGLGVNIGAGYINDTIRPLLNNFLNSDNLKSFVKKVVATSDSAGDGNDDAEAKKARADEIGKIKKEIPYCSGGEGLGGVKIMLVGDPELERAELERLLFNVPGSIGFKLDIKGFKLHLKFYRDDNNDGNPDPGTVLPFLVAFNLAQVDGKLEIRPGGKPLFLISSDHTDCGFKSGAYCKKKPAILIPQNIVGGATRGGSFVRCDDKNQQVDEETRKACEDIDILNAETGELNGRVLDVINDIVYCQGSAYLTYMLRERSSNATAELGCADSDISRNCSNVPSILRDKSIWVSGGLNLAKSRIKISQDGISAALSTRFGSEDMGSHLDDGVTENGILTDPNGAMSAIGGLTNNAIKISVSTALLNELLYQLAYQKEGSGILDWAIDEQFINGSGFDFIKECDSFEPTPEVSKPPAICQMRPRVSEMLGTALVTSGYFTGKQPLLMKLTGSRKLAPHISIYKANVPYELPPAPGEEEIKYEYRPANIMELQIPDLEISFYAYEVDESAGKDGYGNMRVLLDASGRPVVHSMIEGASEDVPIIRIKTTILFAMEIGELQTLPDDPTVLTLALRPVPSLVNISFQETEGGNATIVPDESLLSAFRGKIDFGVEMYGDPENPIKINLPKSISLGLLGGTGENDLLTGMGLEKLVFGREGLSLNFDFQSDAIGITLKPQVN